MYMNLPLFICFCIVCIAIAFFAAFNKKNLAKFFLFSLIFIPVLLITYKLFYLLNRAVDTFLIY